MDAKDIPNDFIENLHFSIVLKATLETESKKKKQKLKDIQDQVTAVKRSVEIKYNERKMMKKLLEIQDEKLQILESTLKVLPTICKERRLEILFIEEGLDSDSLVMKDEQLKYKGIIENYNRTWEAYQKEYEKLDDAIKRKELKIKVEKMKIHLMNLEFKKNQLTVMFEKRKALSDMRLKVLIKDMSQLILDRWKQQNHQDELKAEIGNLSKQYDEMCKKYKIIQQEIEEKTKAEALARRLMPAPTINTSMMQSVFSTTPRPIEKRICRENSLKLDTISVNSLFLDQFCNKNEQVVDQINNDERKDEVVSLQQLSCECSQHSYVDKQASQNSQYDHNVNTIENECRQLSLDAESNHEEDNDKVKDLNNLEAQKITCEAIIEAPRLPASKEAYLGPLSPSKKKLSVRIDDSNHNVSEEPKKKRSKLIDSTDDNSLTSSNLENEKNKTQDSINKVLPSIRQIEIINEPIKIQTKPPMAEVPPTPNLCPNLHYAPSCASSDDHLSMMGDGNYHEIDPNWPNFSPPNRADSNLSFMSNATMFKNMTYDTPAMTMNSEVIANHSTAKEGNSTSPANNPAPNFLNYFSSVKPSTQNFF